MINLKKEERLEQVMVLLIPEGNMRKREYYLYGIKFSEIEWKERCKQREGLPWYKSGTAKGTARF